MGKESKLTKYQLDKLIKKFDDFFLEFDKKSYQFLWSEYTSFRIANVDFNCIDKIK